MDLYGSYDKSIPQKTVMLISETIILALSFWILFLNGFETIAGIFNLHVSEGSYQRHVVIFVFNCIVYIRIWITTTYLIKRKMPWGEALNIAFAFAIYYLGFAMLGFQNKNDLNIFDYFFILVFLTGSFLNTFSELKRDAWKKIPANKGHLYTRGLFKYSMHINYFGDMLWILSYAVITRNIYSSLIVLMAFSLFTFALIPKLDAYLASKYKDEFLSYKSKTKRFIPFVY